MNSEQEKIIDKINNDFDEFQKELDIRDKKLKNIVNLTLDDDVYLELLSQLGEKPKTI